MPMFGKRVTHVPKHMRGVEEDSDTDISHHGIKGMKWGVRRYQNENGHYTSAGKLRRQVLAESNTVKKSLTINAQPFVAEPIDISKVQARGSLSRSEADECGQLATDIFKTAQKHEPQITGDVIDAVSKANAKMYGLDHRMKQPTSLAAKIGSDAKSDGVSFKQASNDIHDAIRYTAVSDPSNFSQTYNSVKKQLEANGYSETQCKNYFKRFNDGKVSHKAVQSVYSTPDGVSFELQFQTPESQAVKKLKIPLYEEARKTSTSEDRRQQLSKQMRMLGDNIKDPDEVFDILEHDGIYSDNVLGTRAYLAHHGIKGMKWGVRRYQNPDGSYTDTGKDRRNKKVSSDFKKKIAIGVGATVGVGAAVAASAYLASKNSDKKLLIDATDAVDKAKSLGEKNLKTARDESKRISNPSINEKDIGDSYKKVCDATEKSIKAEAHAIDLTFKADMKHLLDDDDDASSFRFRTVDEYIPHRAPFTWFDALKKSHPDVFETSYKDEYDKWDKRYHNRKEELW